MANNGQLVQVNQKVSTLRNMLEAPAMKTQIGMALPRHMNVDKLLRITMTSVQRNPLLLDCDPRSICACVIQSAQLGLAPDNATGQAYLIPFWNNKKKAYEAQLIPGYRGLEKLARNSGEISTIQARAVHANDVFDLEFGFDQKLRHVPNLEDPGALRCVYAYAKFKDGGIQVDVMGIGDVEACRARSSGEQSAAKKRKEGKWVAPTPWETDYEEMAKKTVVRRLCKNLPLSAELAEAVSLADREDAGLPQEMGQIFDIEAEVEIEEKPVSALDAVVDAEEEKANATAKTKAKVKQEAKMEPANQDETPGGLSEEDIEFMRQGQEGDDLFGEQA